MKIPISEIKVKDRLREDMGDLDELAESIRKFGLLHPVIVDDNNILVAGERRLEACKKLGMESIEARSKGKLTDIERREIELEENLRRKNLSSFERSKYTTELAETANKAAVEEAERKRELPADSADKSRSRGRPKDPESREAASERTGIPRKTIADAESHVAAAEKYPFLQSREWAQKPAIEMAKILDQIDKKEVNYLLKFVGNGSGGSPETIRRYFQTWLGASPQIREKIKERLDGNLEDRHRTVSLMSKCDPNPDGLYSETSEGARVFHSIVKKYKDHELIEKVKAVTDQIDSVVSEAKEVNKRKIAEQKKEIFA